MQDVQDAIEGHAKKAMEAYEAGKQTEFNILIQKAKEEWFYSKLLDPVIKVQLDNAQNAVKKTNAILDVSKNKLEDETKAIQAVQKRIKETLDMTAKIQKHLDKVDRACIEAQDKIEDMMDESTMVGGDTHTWNNPNCRNERGDCRGFLLQKKQKKGSKNDMQSCKTHQQNGKEYLEQLFSKKG